MASLNCAFAVPLSTLNNSPSRFFNRNVTFREYDVNTSRSRVRSISTTATPFFFKVSNYLETLGLIVCLVILMNGIVDTHFDADVLFAGIGVLGQFNRR